MKVEICMTRSKNVSTSKCGPLFLPCKNMCIGTENECYD